MKFRKKPVVIEAIRNIGTEQSINDVLRFISDRSNDFADLPETNDGHVHTGIGVIPPLGLIEIPTLEGVMTAQPGDWIICGVQGEFYPCKHDIFEATYEAV
jgi:hypothetical protein